jgi:hypothetical protein
MERGGTASFIDFWNRDFHQPLGQTKPKLEIIRLDSFLQDHGAIQGITMGAAIHPEPTARTESNVQQDFRAILVGDVIGFEKLTEEQLPLFNEHFLGAAARLLNSKNDAPMAVNASGNGFSITFEEVDQAGRIALCLREILETPLEVLRNGRSTVYLQILVLALRSMLAPSSRCLIL